MAEGSRLRRSSAWGSDRQVHTLKTHYSPELRWSTQLECLHGRERPQSRFAKDVPAFVDNARDPSCSLPQRRRPPPQAHAEIREVEPGSKHSLRWPSGVPSRASPKEEGDADSEHDGRIDGGQKMSDGMLRRSEASTIKQSLAVKGEHVRHHTIRSSIELKAGRGSPETSTFAKTSCAEDVAGSIDNTRDPAIRFRRKRRGRPSRAHDGHL